VPKSQQPGENDVTLVRDVTERRRSRRRAP
jgi:hypothetical protein